MLRKKGDTEGPNTFYCSICEIGFNDSISYMDHKNGKKHNRVLGMNMKVKKVGLDAVNRKLEFLAQRKKLKNKSKNKLNSSIGIKKRNKNFQRERKRYTNPIISKKEDKNEIKDETQINFIKVKKGEIGETQLIKKIVKEELNDINKKEEINNEKESDGDYVDEDELARYRALGIPLSFKLSLIHI